MKPAGSAARSTVLYAVLVLLLSLAYWLLFALRDWLPFDPSSGFWGMARGYTPAAAAIAAAVIVHGRSELAAIGARLRRWRAPLPLYLLAVLGPLAANLLVLLSVRLMGYDVPWQPGDIMPARLLMLFFVFAVVDGPVGEEIGWRGFFLPRLLERHGAIAASLLLGCVWYLWHLPLYIATGRFQMTLTFLAGYLVNNLSFSVMHTWLFRRSGESAFLAIVFHTASNYFVYLTITLFPGLRDTPARGTYVILLACVGTVAALALRRTAPVPVA